MAERALIENVAQVKADFRAIRDTMSGAGAIVPMDMPTSEYANEIKKILSNTSNRSYEAGKQEIISNSKYIEKQASGKVIRLDDVSEVYHNVVVKADTPTEVKVYGKNLIPYPYNPSMALSQNGITLTINDDGSIVANGTATTNTQFFLYHSLQSTIPISLLPNAKYTLSGCKGGSSTTYELRVSDNKTTAHIIANGKTVFSYADTSNITIAILVRSGATLNNVVFRPQIELGEKATPYEHYQEPQTITATPEGTEIPSNCPAMTFLADSDVTVDYFGSYGMQTEYDRFWDAFQQNGTRANYAYAFYGAGWNEAIFRPKYDIVATSLAETFYGSPIKDLTSILEKQGVALDTSNCTSLSFVFAHTKITNIPKINMSACTNSSSTFGTSTSLVRIEGIVSSEKTVFDKSTFQNCTAFEHCIFEGTIASDINLQWSKLLDLESLLSLINCLKSFNNSTEEWTKTITLSTESWDLLRAQGNIFSWGGLECDITYYLGEGIRWNMA